MRKTLLKDKSETENAQVAVLGLGYVGLPLLVAVAKGGFQAVGFDSDLKRVAAVKKGESYLADVSGDELSALVKKGALSAEADFEKLRTADVIIVAVPTPLIAGTLRPDLSAIETAMREIAKRLRPGQLISLESTTYPGTTDEVVLPILLTSGLKVEQDFFLAYSPERVDPGNREYLTQNSGKIVGAVGPKSLAKAEAFYSRVVENVYPVTSARAAEFAKIFENTFRAVNVALVNEMALFCDKMGLDVWETLGAAFTKPFGIMPFFPGPGVGGHCIPIDPHYLEWKAHECGFETKLISLAGEINRGMPGFVCEKAKRILAKEGLSLQGAKVLVLGVAYKKDTEDWRESPAINVIEGLKKAGATVTYHDPHVPEVTVGAETLLSQPFSENEIKKQDLVLITTDHSAVNYPDLVKWSRRVFDTRNATRAVKDGRERITLI